MCINPQQKWTVINISPDFYQADAKRSRSRSVRVRLRRKGTLERIRWQPCEFTKVIFPLHLIKRCNTILIKLTPNSNKSHLIWEWTWCLFTLRGLPHIPWLQYLFTSLFLECWHFKRNKIPCDGKGGLETGSFPKCVALFHFQVNIHTPPPPSCSACFREVLPVGFHFSLRGFRTVWAWHEALLLALQAHQFCLQPHAVFLKQTAL